MKTKKNKSGIRGWRLLSIVILLAGLNFMAACGFGGNPTKEKPPAAETKAKAEQGEIAPRFGNAFGRETKGGRSPVNAPVI